tara:strand:+ start:968 stop:1177 length:210 start_codon:yes stop_codon:yes gene_type:complete
MRNHNGHTPQEAARAEVLDMIEALAQADEDRNPYVETPSFNASKRKHLARLYYKLGDQWKFDLGATLET